MMTNYHRIMLATDLTTKNCVVAYKAVDYAQQFGARLTLLHVIEPLCRLELSSQLSYFKFLLQRGQQALWKLGKELVVPQFDQVLTVGSVSSKVLEIAEDTQVDLIILGRNEVLDQKQPLGSTAYVVVNRAPCDVLTVSSIH